MSKHTQGPWIVSKTSGMRIFINHDHEHPNRVAGYFAEVRRFTTNHEQVEANARLIAAAPELLEAVQAMIEWDDREKDHAVSFEQRMALCEAAFQKARAAIAKAT